ncbi:MAG: hypothetical protein ACLQIB_06915 [Isosphaeraceae bacterium]
MTPGRIAVLVGIALLVMVANGAVSILYMVVYGHVIDPGHEKPYFQDHVKIAAPYCSIVAGVPLMFLAGSWVGGLWEVRLGVQSAVIVWLAYAVIDLAILAASGSTPRIGVLFAVSFLTKLAAVYFGAFFACRRV